MEASTPDLPQKKLEQYRYAAVLRQRARLHRSKPRRAKAWRIAQQAARLLREQFHATRVVAFGSILHEERFHEWSDIDLAVWGLLPEQTFRAIGAVMDLSSAFEINLVDVNVCPPSLLVSIEREGKDL